MNKLINQESRIGRLLCWGALITVIIGVFLSLVLLVLGAGSVPGLISAIALLISVVILSLIIFGLSEVIRYLSVVSENTTREEGERRK